MKNEIESQTIPNDFIICSDSAWPKGNALNLSTQISLWWLNYLINQPNQTKPNIIGFHPPPHPLTQPTVSLEKNLYIQYSPYNPELKYH